MSLQSQTHVQRYNHVILLSPLPPLRSPSSFLYFNEFSTTIACFEGLFLLRSSAPLRISPFITKMYKSIINEKFVSLVSNKVVRNDVLMNDDVNSYTSNLAGKKKVLVSGTNYLQITVYQSRCSTTELQDNLDSLNSLFCTITYVSFNGPAFAFDSSKINGSSFNVKDQQIDASKLQRYLSSSGFFGSYYRKYDFMYFHALILFDNIYFC